MNAMHDVAVEPRSRLIWPNEAIQIKPVRQVVRGLLAADSIALVMGDAGCGKSTLAVDIGCAVATGKAWNGRAVERGLVVHVAGEGLHGLRQRLAAATLEGRGSEGMPYPLLDHRLDLAQPGDVDELLEQISIAETESGEKLSLLILDTLARCFSIDENNGAEMRLVVSACDRIKTATGATVLLVHHTGKDSTRGARGHSSLRGALDTELLVEGRENPRTLTVTKQRDLPTLEPIAFDLEPINLGCEPDSTEPNTACVVKYREGPPPLKAPSGHAQFRLLNELEKRHGRGEVAWPIREVRVIGKEIGLGKSTAHAATLSLQQSGYLIPSVGGLTLAQGVVSA